MASEEVCSYATDLIDREILNYIELSEGKSFIQKAFIGSKIRSLKKLKAEYQFAHKSAPILSPEGIKSENHIKFGENKNGNK